MSTVQNSAEAARIQPLFGQIAGHMNAIGPLVEELAGPGGPPMLSVYRYELNRRLEDAMHRIKDIIEYRLARTAEGVADKVEAAMADGKAPGLRLAPQE